MNDLVKRGTPRGLSNFAKIAIVIVICMAVGGGVVAYRLSAAYQDVTDATLRLWEMAASSDPAVASLPLGQGQLRASPVWGETGAVEISDREIWNQEAKSSGVWTSSEGQAYEFQAFFIRAGDVWEPVELQIAP